MPSEQEKKTSWCDFNKHLSITKVVRRVGTKEKVMEL